MVETIKYPTPMTKGSKEEVSAKREPEKKERNSPPKRERIRVKKKRCKDERMKRQIDHRIKNLISDIIELDKMIEDIEKKMESKKWKKNI